MTDMVLLICLLALSELASLSLFCLNEGGVLLSVPVPAAAAAAVCLWWVVRRRRSAR